MPSSLLLLSTLPGNLENKPWVPIQHLLSFQEKTNDTSSLKFHHWTLREQLPHRVVFRLPTLRAVRYIATHLSLIGNEVIQGDHSWFSHVSPCLTSLRRWEHLQGPIHLWGRGRKQGEGIGKENRASQPLREIPFFFANIWMLWESICSSVPRRPSPCFTFCRSVSSEDDAKTEIECNSWQELVQSLILFSFAFLYYERAKNDVTISVV